MKSSYQELAIKIKNKAQLYDVLAKIYYLPDQTCRAITKDYLLNYVQKDPQILMVPRKTLIHHHFRFQKYSAPELLELLDKLLKSKGLKPSGLNMTTIPNVEWLMNTIMHVDPSDPYELLTTKKEEKIQYTIEVSQE